MKEWLPILTLVLGWVLGGGYMRFTERGRLPNHIDRRLAIWKDMPDGQAKDELRARIESDVRYLLAHDDHPTMKERRTNGLVGLLLLPHRWSWRFFAEVGPSFTIPSANVVLVVAPVMLTIGLMMVAGARRSMGLMARRRVGLWDDASHRRKSALYGGASSPAVGVSDFPRHSAHADLSCSGAS